MPLLAADRPDVQSGHPQPVLPLHGQGAVRVRPPRQGGRRRDHDQRAHRRGKRPRPRRQPQPARADVEGPVRRVRAGCMKGVNRLASCRSSASQRISSKLRFVSPPIRRWANRASPAAKQSFAEWGSQAELGNLRNHATCGLHSRAHVYFVISFLAPPEIRVATSVRICGKARPPGDARYRGRHWGWNFSLY